MHGETPQIDDLYAVDTGGARRVDGNFQMANYISE